MKKYKAIIIDGKKLFRRFTAGLLLLSLHLVPTCFFLFILTYFYSDNYVFCRNYKLLASYFIIPSNVFFASRQRSQYLCHFD